MVHSSSKRVSVVIAVLGAVLVATCSNTDKLSGPGVQPAPPGAPPAPPAPAPSGPPASIELTASGLGQMAVNEMRSIVVVVRDQAGNVLTDIVPAFLSSDTSIAKVSAAGIITARWPGNARIDVTAASLKTSYPVAVFSRLRIGLELMDDWAGDMEMAVGDTVRLKPYVTDANGHILDVRPDVTWSSTNPNGISVDARGLLTAREQGATAEIQAVGPLGVGLKTAIVSIPLDGRLATVRFAHAAAEFGAITFVPSKGAAKTLNAGQAATFQVAPGMLLVSVDAGPDAFHSFGPVDGISIRAGEKATLYVVGVPGEARLWWVWTNPVTVPPDQSFVEVMQGSAGYPVLYINPQGSELDGPPASCYFDWGDFTERDGPPGMLTFSLLGKYPDKTVREALHFEAKGGMKSTVILAGSPGSMTYFSFPDL